MLLYKHRLKSLLERWKGRAMKASEFKDLIVKHKDDCASKFTAPSKGSLIKVHLKNREDPFLAVCGVDVYKAGETSDVSSMMGESSATFKVLGTLTDHAVFVPFCGADPADKQEVVVKKIQIAPKFVESVEFLAKFGE